VERNAVALTMQARRKEDEAKAQDVNVRKNGVEAEKSEVRRSPLQGKGKGKVKVKVKMRLRSKWSVQ